VSNFERKPSVRTVLLWLSTIFAVDQAMYSTIAPLVPVLQDALALSGTQIGLLVGAYPLGLVFFAVPAGQLATRWGARPMVVLGAAILAVASLGFGMAPQFEMLVAMRFAQGAAASLTWAGGLAWASGLAGEGRQGMLIGSLLSATVFGTLAGPALGAVAAQTGRTPAFILVAAASGICAVALWRQPASADKHGSRLIDVVRAMLSPPLAPLAWVTVLCAVLIGALLVSIPLRLTTFGISATAIGLLFVAIAIVEIIGSPLVGRLHDRRGARVPLIGCMVVGATALVGFSFASGAVSATVLAGLAVPACSLLLTPALAGVSTIGAERGLAATTVFGVTNFLWAIGESIGALLAGSLSDRGTTWAAGNLSLAMVLAASVFVVMTLKRAQTP
jgi:predicted MFS family arabinose efflux permease